MAIPRSLMSLDPFELRRFLSPTAAETQAAISMPLDVREKGNAYMVQVELPGAKKEDISVNIDGNQVSISAEIKAQNEESDKEGRVLHKERFYGKLSRTFQLGAEIDEEKSEATFNDGILELTLYKKEAAAAKQLKIT